VNKQTDTTGKERHMLFVRAASRLTIIGETAKSIAEFDT